MLLNWVRQTPTGALAHGHPRCGTTKLGEQTPDPFPRTRGLARNRGRSALQPRSSTPIPGNAFPPPGPSDDLQEIRVFISGAPPTPPRGQSHTEYGFTTRFCLDPNTGVKPCRDP